MAKKRKTSFEASSTSDSSSALTTKPSPTVIQNSSAALVQNSHEFIEENIKEALLDWLKEQPLYLSKSPDGKKLTENVVKDLADELVTIIKQTPNTDNMDPVLLEEIKKHVQKFPVDPKQKSSQKHIDELPMQILDQLKSLQLFQGISRSHDRPSINKNAKKKAAVVLLEDIANWIKNLPFETEEAVNTKEQLESKLIHKIGELNMNSEIFNDDFIYDDILDDAVENLLADIPGEEIKNNLPALKKDLLAFVKKARKKIRDENVGQIYKQQLCETISNTLPSFELTVEGKASFEVLKDDVADAFISMCYVGDNKEEANKLKKKINDEIYRFCNEYLKKCPASPIDTTKLNVALYNALKNITKPQNESFTDDVELVKIKDEINNWAKELPLKNHTGQEKLHTNKMISVLAKKIFDIENEKELIPSEEYEETMKKEIAKFLKKLPMVTENDDDIHEMIEKLVKILKDTKDSRKLKASTIHSIQPLVKEKLAKLRISFNDASVSPCPVDTCSQTFSSSKCSGPSQCLDKKSSSVQTPCKRMQAAGSQIDVTPSVVVNEYHWDSIDESSTQPPRVPCPCPTPSRPPYVVMPQPIESPISSCQDESSMLLPRPSCPGSTASRSPYKVMPQQPQSPISELSSECAALNSCLTTRPFPLQPFKNKFIKPHEQDQINPCSCAQLPIRVPPPCPPPDYDNDYDYQLPENPTPYRYEPQAKCTQAGMQCSDQSFGSVLDESNPFQRGNRHSTPCQLPRTPSSNPSYPYHISTDPVIARPGQSPQRNRADSQSSQYARQPSPCPTSREEPAQRNVRESQYIPYTQYPGSQQMGNRHRSYQDSQPMTPNPFMMSCPPHFCRGQSYVAPRGSVPFSPSPQMPCVFNPRSPCYMRPGPPTSSEEYVPGYNCSFQKSATHFEDEEPQTCMSRYQDWGNLQDDFEYWERDKQNFDSVEVNNRREGRRCKICKHRYGECNARRF